MILKIMPETAIIGRSVLCSRSLGGTQHYCLFFLQATILILPHIKCQKWLDTSVGLLKTFPLWPCLFLKKQQSFSWLVECTLMNNTLYYVLCWPSFPFIKLCNKYNGGRDSIIRFLSNWKGRNKAAAELR